MATITFDDLNNTYTNLNVNEILDIITKYLADLPSLYNATATLTEMTYDPLYDEFLPHGNTSHMWSIDFNFEEDDSGRLFFNYDTFYIMPIYEILVSFLESEEGNIIDFTNNSKVRRGELCDDQIIQLKYRIKKEEYSFENRYAEREHLLLLINGAITNYGDFNTEDLTQVNFEKNVSKKRQVLENPWFHREVLEYLEDTETVIPEFLLKRSHGCLLLNY